MRLKSSKNAHKHTKFFPIPRNERYMISTASSSFSAAVPHSPKVVPVEIPSPLEACLADSKVSTSKVVCPVEAAPEPSTSIPAAVLAALASVTPKISLPNSCVTDLPVVCTVATKTTLLACLADLAVLVLEAAVHAHAQASSLDLEKLLPKLPQSSDLCP